MFSTGRRRIAWLLASTLWVACGGSAPKVETPRAADADDREDVDPDEFEISDEPDRELAESDEEPAEKKPAPEENQVAEAEEEEEPEKEEPPPPKPKKAVAAKPKKVKKVVEREPEPEEAEADVEEDEPPRERVNRGTMALHKKRGDNFAIGSGRSDREARMARDERARASKKGRRTSAREREEEDDEDKAAREEEARDAKAAKAEKLRAAKDAKAEKARAAKDAKAEKARKAKEAKDAKVAAAKEAREEKARKAKEAKASKVAAAKKRDEDEESADDEEESAETDDEEADEEEAPKKVAKKGAKVDEDVIEMDGEDEEEDRGKSIASIQEDNPLEEDDRVEAAAEEAPAPVAPLVQPLNDRALTIAAKKLEVHGGLGITAVTLPGATAGTTVSSTSETLALGVAYGLGPKAEVGADYTLSLNPGTVKGPLAFHVAYAAKKSAKLDIAIAGGLAFDFVASSNAVTMMTTTTTYASLQLGAWARYRATPKVSLFTGLPATPSSASGLSKQTLALPPFAYQVAFGLNNAGTKAIEVPFGIGFQAKPNIYAFVSLDLAHIRLKDTQSAVIFADFIPFTLGAFYTRNKLDIGVQLSDDLKQGFDYLHLATVLRYLVK